MQRRSLYFVIRALTLNLIYRIKSGIIFQDCQGHFVSLIHSNPSTQHIMMHPTQGTFIALPLILTLFDSERPSIFSFGVPDNLACKDVVGSVWEAISSFPERKRPCSCRTSGSI